MSTQTKNKENNQTEAEFFAMVGTGRKGVEDMLVNMADEFKKIGAPNVSQEYSVWAQRALVYIANSEELQPLTKTRKGIFSIYKELAKAAQMGIQMGGHFAHAFLVPFGGEATLIVSWEGYAFAAAHGPGAVLKYVPKLVEVFEKDEFKVQEAEGTFTHNYSPFGDRGKLVGYFMKLEYIDGRIELPYVTLKEVEEIIQHYGNQNSPAYKKSRIDMYRKTAAKKLLKKPAKEAEGLAMMYQADYERFDQEDTREEPIDITDRATSRLDDIIQKTEEPQSEDPPEKEPEEEPAAEEKQQEKEPEAAGSKEAQSKDLF